MAVQKTLGVNGAVAVFPIEEHEKVLGLQLTGTWSATVQFEASIDNGLTWISVAGQPIGALGVLGTAASSATANDEWVFGLAGFTHFRLRVSAYVSGSVVADVETTDGPLYSGGGTAALGTVILGAGSALVGKVGIDQTTPGTTNQVQASPNITTIKTSVIRPNDVLAYALGDAFADSTSAPTAGGYTFAGAARASGGSGELVDAIISMSGNEALIGEIHVFDQAVTAINDNAAYAVSDADILNEVAVIPFTCVAGVNNSLSYVTQIGALFTCVGSANLRFLVKILAAITPTAQSKLAITLKVKN